MKNYRLVPIHDDQYRYLVIATSYISPISNLEDIQIDLGIISGSILFDLTLINGTNSNRYISADIENGVISRKTFRKVSVVNPEIREESSRFFKCHSEIVEGGTITQALKYLLVNGDA